MTERGQHTNMNDEFYRMVNADVIKNKEILADTGRSPAKENFVMRNSVHFVYIPKKEFQQLLHILIQKGKDNGWILNPERSWRNLWVIIMTRKFFEDNFYELLGEGEAPRHKWYQRTYYDFDRDCWFAYPIGISQIVAIARTIFYGSYAFLRRLRGAPIFTERDIERARRAGFKDGRDFEFRTSEEHRQGMGKLVSIDAMRRAIDVEKDYPFAAPEEQLNHFIDRLSGK